MSTDASNNDSGANFHIWLPARRRGIFRLGTDQWLSNDQGESSISVEDYAIALLDKIERPQFIRRRFTAVSLKQ